MNIKCMTDIGRVREVNEDDCVHCEIGIGWDLIIVADGMGGHNAGEVASKIAVQTITQYIKDNFTSNHSTENVSNIIKESISIANHNIYMESRNNASCSGMGTTVTAAVMSDDAILIGHVGDSRAYVLKGNSLHKITNDHSLVAELVKNGTITELEAEHHPQKNIITRALGTSEDIEIDIESVAIEHDDVVLLCTDGLSNMVCDNEIRDVLIRCSDVSDGAKKLIDMANEAGGHDNVTVIVAKAACTDCEVRQ